MSIDWLVGDHTAVAAERILDVAGQCFAERGVAGATMGDIAAAAGCSRPTIYRYFQDRDALRMAFVHREARRIGARIAADAEAAADPTARLVDAMVEALSRVRSDPVLAAWFRGDQRSTATDIAATSQVILAITAAFLGDPTDDDIRDRARWVVRIVLSLLNDPGDSEAEERRLLQRYLAPVVVPVERPTPRTAIRRRERT
jgi:AcrR family transcriptional regulator